jgi:hypothetical protein
MTRVLVSAADRQRLVNVTRRANYGVTFKDLAWLLHIAARLLAERDELLQAPPFDAERELKTVAARALALRVDREITTLVKPKRRQRFAKAMS